MRRRSISGPLVLLLVGGIFLWNNLHPEVPVWDLIGRNWPFLLIGWGLVRLIEVLIWHADAENGSSTFSGGEIVLVVMVCLVGMGMFEANRSGFHFRGRSLDMFGQQFDYPVNAHGAATGIKRVVFENPRGNIKVTGADVQEIVVSGHKMVRAYDRSEADRADHSTPVEVVTQGDRVLIRSNQDKISSNSRISHDLEVTVPRGVTVESRNTSGDYDVSEIAGGVELSGDRGDVRLARVGGNARVDMGRSDVIRALELKGSLDLRSSHGSDVELENVDGQVTISGAYSGRLEFKNLAKPLHFESRNTELRVAALPGRISMDLGGFTGSNLVGPTKLVTKSRDIKIEQFTQSLELETDRGDIELQPSNPIAAIEARSRTGRIDLVVPDKASFQLQATAEHGDAINDFGPALQREVDGQSATLKGKVGGGPTIHLTTDRGSVAVRKAGTVSSQPREADEMPRPPRPPKLPKVPVPPSGKSLSDTETKL